MPVEISDWDDLDNVRNDLDGDYVLVNDLDENTAGYSTSWDPIGIDAPDPVFTGSFDGGGFSILDLDVSEFNESILGLFSILGDGAVVENLTVGGSVSGSGSDPVMFHGGLAGRIDEALIRFCASHVDVDSGNVDNAGSFAGSARGTVIERSLATGSVATEGERAGGFVGENDEGDITSCYAFGSVNSENRRGGFAGANEGTIRTSYSTGEVEGGDISAGFVAVDQGSEEIDCYWNRQTSGQTQTGGSAERLNDSEMRGAAAEDNMVGFDFSRDWYSVAEGESIGVVVPDGDGFPIVRPIDQERQLDSQDITSTVGITLSVETGDVTDISAFSAVFSGELVELGAEVESADVSFDFGSVVSDNQSPPETLTELSTFGDSVDGLSSGEDQEYRAVAEAEDSDGNTFTVEGDIETFTTDETQIDVQTNEATDVEAFQATVNGEVVDIGDYDSAETFFEFGVESVDDDTTDVVVVDSPVGISDPARPLESDSPVVEFRAVAIGENDGARYEGDVLTFSTDTAAVSGVINPDAPDEGAVVDVRNKTKGESYGRDRTGADGEYLFAGISGAEVGDMLEILVDVKREGDTNVSRAIYPTFGTEPPNE